MTQELFKARPNCHIEFRVYDNQRFEILRRFFEPLQNWTRSNYKQMASDASYANSRHFNKDETQERLAITKDETRQRRDFARPEEWLLAFRPQDLDYLGMPNHAESITAMREWHGLSRRERRKLMTDHANEERLRILADFSDMLRYWQDVEYELVTCEMSATDKARITYQTFDYPFEGKAALEELLMFFGFLSVIEHSC